jgi:hypothetical protein
MITRAKIDLIFEHKTCQQQVVLFTLELKVFINRINIFGRLEAPRGPCLNVSALIAGEGRI